MDENRAKTMHFVILRLGHTFKRFKIANMRFSSFAVFSYVRKQIRGPRDE